MRSIEGHSHGVDVVAISPTAGDIASASRQGKTYLKYIVSIVVA